MTTKAKQLAVCGAPAGGCGFRGRDWRRGQIVASYGSNGEMYCRCGSEMRLLKKTRFEIVRLSEVAASGVCEVKTEGGDEHEEAQR